MPVDSRHHEYDEHADAWTRCRDAVRGQAAVHRAGERYLPKLAGQTDAEYDAYRGRALYYGATARTVDGLTGLIFRKAPTVDAPEAMQPIIDDVDLSDTPLTAWAEGIVEHLMTVGRVGILAEYPPMPSGITQAQEQALGGRPYLTTYSAASIINWRTERIGGANRLTMVVLREEAYIPTEDGFGADEVERWRVLRMDGAVYIQELYRKEERNGKTEFVLEDGYPMTPQMGGASMDFIPFLICGPRGIGAEISKPPILDLADVNLSHYRSTADYEHGLHFTALPTPWVTGHEFEKGETFVLGSTAVRGFSNPETRVGFLEFSGSGLSTLSTRLKEKEEMMAALGARMLAAEKRQAEAAETASIHRAGENSVLASIAIAASHAISKALTWAAMFMRLSEPVTVRLNTDYLPARMSAQDVQALVAAWQSGAYSHQTLHEALQRGEVVPADRTFEDELALIAEEPPPLGMASAQDSAPVV